MRDAGTGGTHGMVRQVALVIGLLVTSGCGSGEQSGNDTDTRSGESGDERAAVSDISVELFGAGSVSTDLPEFAASFSPDGDTVFFNRTPEDRSRLELFVSVRSGDSWLEAVPFTPTEGIVAIDPFVSLDGTRLYYSSDQPGAEGDARVFDFWVTQRSATGWSPARRLPEPIRSDSSDVFNSFTSDGTMIFSSRRSGPRQIYSTRFADGVWTVPERLTFGDFEGGSNPMISPDGTFLVFAAPGANGRPDLMVTCAGPGGWSHPAALPSPINTEFTEFAPGISGESLYFTSERPGIVGPQPDSVRPPGDIYRTDLAPVREICANRDE